MDSLNNLKKSLEDFENKLKSESQLNPETEKIFKIARYILNYSKVRNFYINNLKLNLIIYHVYGFYLACYEEELFKDSFIAYYVPSVEKIYRKYCMFGTNPIPIIKLDETIDLPKNLKETIEDFTDQICKISAFDLAEEIRKTKPYVKARLNNNIIDKDDIKKYFNSFIQYTNCNNCGQQIDVNFNYCPYCGEKVEEKE